MLNLSPSTLEARTSCERSTSQWQTITSCIPKTVQESSLHACTCTCRWRVCSLQLCGTHATAGGACSALLLQLSCTCEQLAHMQHTLPHTCCLRGAIFVRAVINVLCVLHGMNHGPVYTKACIVYGFYKELKLCVWSTLQTGCLDSITIINTFSCTLIPGTTLLAWVE